VLARNLRESYSGNTAFWPNSRAYRPLSQQCQRIRIAQPSCGQLSKWIFIFAHIEWAVGYIPIDSEKGFICGDAPAFSLWSDYPEENARG
jgi:hypothetical protein